METLREEYLKTFIEECKKSEVVMNRLGFKFSHINDGLDSWNKKTPLRYSYYFSNHIKDIELNFAITTFYNFSDGGSPESFLVSFNLSKKSNPISSFSSIYFLEDNNLDSVIKSLSDQGGDFHQTIRDYFKHCEQLFQNELKETILGNEVHDHSTRTMQSYLDYIYASPKLTEELYGKPIREVKKNRTFKQKLEALWGQFIFEVVSFFEDTKIILKFIWQLITGKR